MTSSPTPQGGAVSGTTRERIVAAAVDLFAEQGFDATSVNQVVVRAGVAKGALYHHFASKDALLYEVYAELIERQLRGLQQITAAGGTAERQLRALVADLVETTATKAKPAMVFFREGHRLSDEGQAAVRRSRRQMHDAVRSLVAEAQLSGEFAAVATPDIVTFTLFGVINELPVWYSPAGSKRPAEIAAEISDLLLAALVR